jgi:hypothetical protein
LTRFCTDVLEDMSAWMRWKRGLDDEELPWMVESSFIRELARSELAE